MQPFSSESDYWYRILACHLKSEGQTAAETELQQKVKAQAVLKTLGRIYFLGISARKSISNVGHICIYIERPGMFGTFRNFCRRIQSKEATKKSTGSLADDWLLSFLPAVCFFAAVCYWSDSLVSRSRLVSILPFKAACHGKPMVSTSDFGASGKGSAGPLHVRHDLLSEFRQVARLHLQDCERALELGLPDSQLQEVLEAGPYRRPSVGSSQNLPRGFGSGRGLCAQRVNQKTIYIYISIYIWVLKLFFYFIPLFTSTAISQI